MEYFSVVREAAGTKYDEIDVEEGSTVREVLDRLVSMHKPEFKRALFDGDELKHFLQVIVDGKNVRSRKGLSTVLTKPSTILIFPPFGGG